MGHEVPFIVRGNSMEPTYHNGDLLRVCKSSSYDVGDVIVFNFESYQIVHRIIKIEEGYFFCKGDHAAGVQKITKKDILGKVCPHA